MELLLGMLWGFYWACYGASTGHAMELLLGMLLLGMLWSFYWACFYWACTCLLLSGIINYNPICKWLCMCPLAPPRRLRLTINVTARHNHLRGIVYQLFKKASFDPKLEAGSEPAVDVIKSGGYSEIKLRGKM